MTWIVLAILGATAALVVWLRTESLPAVALLAVLAGILAAAQGGPR